MISDSVQTSKAHEELRDGGACEEQGGSVGADTYPHTLRVVFQSVQPTEHRLPVLLPLPLAEDYFQEVPGPANQRDFQELVFGEHFGTLHNEEELV